ncbi:MULTISPECIES: phage portal protein [Clostridium]|uniref:Phage portal protein n=1 Tax=Clostridium frigoriphilum TaxID=443253 RepID=A0ABU7UU33_9CLOT|nr:phage portal protein [Clostridium sp. DSM 17811]MBU3098736.1 phage portal protein [Clostridium sp. DSM 17811]
MEVSTELLKAIKIEYDTKKIIYDKMLRYYDGDTDSKRNYKKIKSRSNLFADNNYIMKFIQEEANYCCLNKVTYSSHTGNKAAVDSIRLALRNYSEGYNKELLKQALIFQEAYSLHYINSNGDFASLICTPQNSYILQDDFGNIQLFIRFFKKKFNTVDVFADVYTDDSIIHYKVNGTFVQIGDIDGNIFSSIPVGICKIGSISESLYSKLSGLEDAYCTNLSDQTNLNSDLRTKYLHFKNCDPSPEQMDTMKENATITTSGEGDVRWVQSTEVSFESTINILQDNIYQQASHLNFNNPLSSNTSSLALQGTMMAMNQKVGDDITAMTDCLKVRIKFIFEYLKIKVGSDFSWKDILIKITANIPSDNLLASQILSQNPNISRKTGYGLYSFIDSPEAEEKQKDLEDKANSIGNDLLNPTIPVNSTVPDVVEAK